MNIGAFMMMNTVLRNHIKPQPIHAIPKFEHRTKEPYKAVSYNEVVLYKKLQENGYIPDNMSFEEFKDKLDEEINGRR